MKYLKTMTLFLVLAALAGCSTPTRTENGVTIDDKKKTNYLFWLQENM